MASDAENDDRSPSHSADESESGSEAAEAGDDHEMEDKDRNGKDGGSTKKANAKDPSRPRRKKARRACYACQRAHLTCGDERPCQRCVKRGLQDTCQDGVRKKAKYLHDAPPEALLPGANRYQYIGNLQQGQQTPHQTTNNYTGSTTESFVQQPQSGYSGYGPSPPTSAMTLNDSLMSSDLNGPQSPLTAQLPASAGLPGFGTSMAPQDVTDNTNGLSSALSSAAGFSGNFFDPGELAQYDFDPSSFKFGNVYGAIEFGMLGHLSSGAGVAGSPPADVGNPMNQNLNAFATPNTISMGAYGESPVDGSRAFIFGQDGSGLGDWRTTQPSQTQSNVRGGGNGGNSASLGNGRRENGLFEQDPRAFSLGVNSALPSPTSGRSPEQYSTSRRPGQSPGSRPNSGAGSGQDAANSFVGKTGRGRPPTSQATFNVAAASRAFAPKRKRGDPSTIYTAVTQPYSYITGFHSLIMLLQKRFAPAKVVRIAKALASIRPSFMSCTRLLSRDDLIFMEKCFQRTLWEYEDFINACGTPTVVCRRTGEIAAAGKEFSILTKWRRDVLLGREANLNVNTGASAGAPPRAGVDGGSSRGGVNTPRIPEHMIDNSRPHPVSLAELLDEDSVVAFYEDFARLAFGDSKGVVTTRYKLLKYRTKEEIGTSTEAGTEGRGLKRKRSDGRPGMISGEAGIDDLGEDGKVECSCCWMVKRDIFDLPMMIVMNFLPCI